MAKSYASVKMDSPTARLKNCKVRPAPYWEVLRAGCTLGYRSCKKGGSWIAKYYIPDAKPSRKQKDLGPADDPGRAEIEKTLSYDQAKEAALAWFKAEAKRARGLEEVPKAPYSVKQCMDDYMSSYEKAGGRASKDTLRVINAHILPAFGKRMVAELTKAMIQEWLENLASTPARIRSSPNGKQKFKELPDEYEAKRKRRSTANRILTVLKAALNKAADLEKVDCSVNAWTLVKPFRKADAARVRFLSIEDQKKLVDVCEPDFRKLVQAALFTSARYGELSRLMHVRDFDEQNGQIYITSESKSEKCRHIVLSEEGIHFFKELVAGRKQSERMFLMANGRGWISGEQMRPMRKAVKAAEIEDGLTFHELRHTYASTLIMAGVPVSVIAMQLGHTDTRMVDKHYGHLAKKYVTDTIRSLSPKLNLVAANPFEEMVQASA